jgi:serine/threonine protein kinase
VDAKLVAGRYLTIRELGRGGMGIVWLAEDQVIGRRVALKELRTTSPVELERVLREARTAGRLNTPAVVAVYDVIAEQGTTYIVMELVEAPTLADVMARQGALPEDRVAEIGLHVLGALDAAHAAGVVHRDVKPSNIMVLTDGRAKLADFGIARALDDPSLTMTGGIMGSPGYMAPELFAGSPPAPASDLWALGATLFHAVEGRAPFNRDTTAATMHAVMYEEPVLDRCQGPLGAVIMGLLTQSVDGRLTAAQLREQLADGTRVVRRSNVEADTVIVEAPTSFVAEPPRSTQPVAPTPWSEDPWADDKPKGSRRKIGVIAGAALAVAAVALTAIFVIKPAAQQGVASAEQGADPSTTSSSVATSSTESSAPTTTTTASSSSAPPSTTSTRQPTKAADNPAPNPQPTTAPPKPPRETLAFSRYRNGAGWHYGGTAKLPVPSGFSLENTGGLGKVLANAESGTRPLYSCDVNDSEDRMSSISADCEGNGVYGLLGYVFTSKPADVASLPLYRCNMGGHHFDSVTTDCEGKTVEGQAGWVLS